MKGVNDLSPIVKAPAIEDLIISDMPQLKPNDFKPFIGHPSLKRAGIWLGSNKKNEAINQMLLLEKLSYSKNDFTFFTSNSSNRENNKLGKLTSLIY